MSVLTFDGDASRAAGERLVLAQRALGFGIWDWDLVHQRIDWSSEMYDILGLDPAVYGDDPYAGWLQVLHPDERELQNRLARESALKGEGFSRTFRIVRPDTSEIRWIRTDATVVHDAGGKAIRMVGVNLDVTEQHRAAEALRESQAELRLITDALPELISFIDRSGVYRFANRAYEDWYGQSPADIVGRDVRSILGEDAFAVRRPYIERALDGEDCSLDVEVTRADGRVRFGEARYLPHRDEAGVVDGFYAYVIDITDRKRQEVALRESAERLRLATEGTGLGIYDLDLATGEGTWSESAFRVLGLVPPADGRGTYATWRARIHPDDLGMVEREHDQCARRGGPWQTEYRIVRADTGEVRWLRVHGRFVTLPHGGTRSTGVVMDTTDRKRAEEILAENEARLRLTAEAAQIGTWDLDLRTGAGKWDEAALRLGGLPPGFPEFDRNDWLRLIHPADQERILAEFQASLAPGGPAYNVEFRCAAPAEDGGPRWLSSHGAVLREPGTGKPIRTVGIVQDTTGRRRAEEKIRESEQRFRSLADAMPQLVWTAGEDGVVDYYNRRRNDFADLKEAGPGRWDWAPAVHPDDLARTVEAWKDATRSRAVYACEHRLARADGGWAWHISRAVPVADNGLVRWYGTATDIDELKQTQAALAESAAALNALVANAPIGFAFFDREHRYTRINAVLAEINGIAAQAHLGRRIEDLLPVNAPLVTPVLDHVFVTGEAVSSVEINGETPALPGEPRAWLVGFFPVLDADGAVAQVGATVIDITDRKRAEVELAASEARFRGVFESGAVGFSIFDANTGATLAINDRLLAMTGHSRADFDEGRWDWRDFTPREHLHLDVAAVSQARTQGFWSPFEKEFIHKDGTRVPVRLSSAPLPGEPGRVVSVVDDLTPMKAAEARLRENEERLRLATENAEIGLWDVDEVHQVLHWPDRVKAMFGISPGVPATMRDFYDGLHPDNRDRVSEAYAAAADPSRRALYDVEYRTIGKEDGVLRWVAAKGRGVFDTAGTCLRVIGTAVDITPRKMAEERLRELNETLERRVAVALAERKLLADIVEGTDAFVQVADLGFRWLAINKAASDEFETIFGVRPAVGQSMLDVISHLPAHQAAVRAVWSRALAGEEFTEVSEFGDPERARRFYEKKFNTLRDARGQVIGAYQFVYDVTQRMLEQERLRKAEEALQQAQKMEAVGQLTGGIAHDFNNLLQGVAGSLDLIRRKPGDREKVQRWADAGFSAAQRGAKLTSQLLAFSRTQKMELKPIALAELISGFQDMVARTIGAHIRVRLDLASGDVLVLGDEVQIEMAVLNLALNARDAMPDGGELAIRTRILRLQRDAELADGDYVELSVSDTGTGMPPDVIARAFDPFFTTKGVGKGTGLGLSQVYGAMRQAGGSVRIDSRVGEGTTVRLILPRTHDARAKDEWGPNELDAVRVSARILVIDDDADVRRFLAESLAALGFGVVEAEDGRSGLTAIEHSRPDIVILDFAMPGMNGANVLKRIREIDPDLPVILATGFAESAALDAIAPPDTPVLRKPFGLDELQLVLNEVLYRHD